MAIRYRDVCFGGLTHFTAEVPDGAVIGLVGEESPALAGLLQLASGVAVADSGTVESSEPRRHIGPTDVLNLGPAATIAIENALACHDPLVRTRARIGIERLRRSGSCLLILSFEYDLLSNLSDELWWIHEGKLLARGEPREVLSAFQTHIGIRLREWTSSITIPLEPSMRRGDGRARLLAIVPLDGGGNSSAVWRSGDPVAVRVVVRFEQPVDDPVVGIMIRTRIGMEVYGTNTELEGLKLGPCAAGETLQVIFQFSCGLCPQEYTLTAASHDPDGVWHDWMEDAVALTVTDIRYTAGVANLRAAVSVSRLSAEA
jgi:lipopolysaccharide transport system ATP-binding protein